ncbi:MAG TPA: DNA gyrase subunit A [Thermotogota bacterium]|nr:DNA gyrase subunit A [Thermotogota bacterium]HRW91987.1 DNA gyrase subunit A [Thermotogota bacterium]
MSKKSSPGRPFTPDERIIPRPFDDELTESYINYSMSVIVGRAIPDVRDGLKPVQRKILYGMRELKNWSNQPHKKSARIVGEVMGKYHPHGDMAIYLALVRMAQDFNMREMLVDGQGNFGSIDRDPPAAPRYTEARLSKLAEEMLADLDKETVNFSPNFDETLTEPDVLPSGLPNLLLNGASGIAVGMATNIPTHNLKELVDGLAHLIDNPDASVEDLMRFIKGPDFPTGGKIMGSAILRTIYTEGQGSLVMEGVYEVEEDRIVITEIPYGVCKSSMIEQIAEYFKKQDRKMVRDIRDESDRRGMRVVIEIARGVSPKVVLNHILKHSQLRTTFPTKLLVIDARRKPRVMNLKELLQAYLDHRYDVIRRKAEFELSAASKRAHIVEGLIRAIRSIDTTIDIIRNSRDNEQARTNLMEMLEITDEQARAILDLRLGRLTNIEISNLKGELQQLTQTIGALTQLLGDPANIRQETKRLLLEVREKYGNPRRTRILRGEADVLEVEDLVVDGDVVLTVTKRGYLLLSSLESYRNQNRGGRGSKGIKTREEDYARQIMVTTKLSNTLFVSSLGKVYVLKNYEIDDASKGSRGKHIMTYLKSGEGEQIRSVLKMGKEFDDNRNIVFLTSQGKVKKVPLSQFARAGTNGIIGLRLAEGDQVVDSALVPADTEDLNLFIGTSHGMAIRFPVKDVRTMGRNAIGVKGISLKNGDQVVSLTVIDPEDSTQTVLTVTERGFGKRTSFSEYRLQARGGVGLKNFSWKPELGEVVAVKVLSTSDELIVVTRLGFTIRFSATDIRAMGRVTRGVKTIDLGLEDSVASVERIEIEE